MIVPNLKLMKIVQYGLALEVCDYHRVNSHCFGLLHQIIELVKFVELIDTIKHGFPLVVLDLQ